MWCETCAADVEVQAASGGISICRVCGQKLAQSTDHAPDDAQAILRRWSQSHLDDACGPIRGPKFLRHERFLNRRLRPDDTPPTPAADGSTQFPPTDANRDNSDSETQANPTAQSSDDEVPSSFEAALAAADETTSGNPSADQIRPDDPLSNSAPVEPGEPDAEISRGTGHSDDTDDRSKQLDSDTDIRPTDQETAEISASGPTFANSDEPETTARPTVTSAVDATRSRDDDSIRPDADTAPELIGAAETSNAVGDAGSDVSELGNVAAAADTAPTDGPASLEPSLAANGPTESSAADQRAAASVSDEPTARSKTENRTFRVDGPSTLNDRSSGSRRQRTQSPAPRRTYAVDAAHPRAGIREPHFEVGMQLQNRRSNLNVILGQWLAYIGVLGLTVGTAIVVYAHFGGYNGYTPTGWLVTTVGQMLLFLGVINLVSGGMEQSHEEVNERIQILGEHILRIEHATDHVLRGPHFDARPGASREPAVHQNGADEASPRSA